MHSIMMYMLTTHSSPQFRQCTPFQYLCAMLHIIGNVLLIGLYFSVWALLGGRLLIGLAHGICYVCLVQHAGDNAAKEVRGRSLGNIGIMLTLAICVCVANATVDPYIAASVYGDATARLAMSALAFACLGGLLVRLLCEESVLRLILQQQGAAETDETLMRLRGERQVTRAVYEELLELKQMVADETRLSSLIHMNGNVRPLVLLCGLRMLQFCTNNVLLNSVVLDLPTEVYVAAPVTGVIGLDDSSSILPTALIFAPLLVVTVRLIFAAAAALAADNVRRRWMLMPAGCGGGAILLGMAVLLTLVGAGRLEDRSGYAGLYVLLFAGVQALYGWSADAVPHIVAAEAFGVNKKAWSVAFACSVEQALHAVTLGLSGALLPDVRVPEVRVSDVHMGLMYAFGVLTLALVGALFVQMPSAAGGLSLAQCRQKWRGAGGGVVYSRAYLGNLQREQAYKISVY